MTEKEKKIFDMQAPSTKKCLSRDPADDWQWHNRKIKDWVAVPEAKTDEERVGARPLGYQEVKVYNRLRYNRGEYIAQMRKDDELSSVSNGKRERAVNAFMFVRMKFKDLMRMAGLAPKLEKVSKNDD